MANNIRLTDKHRVWKWNYDVQKYYQISETDNDYIYLLPSPKNKAATTTQQ